MQQWRQALDLQMSNCLHDPSSPPIFISSEFLHLSSILIDHRRVWLVISPCCWCYYESMSTNVLVFDKSAAVSPAFCNFSRLCPVFFLSFLKKSDCGCCHYSYKLFDLILVRFIDLWEVFTMCQCLSLDSLLPERPPIAILDA